jgi:polyphosphate kinase
VVAIKMTLYRTGSKSAIADALVKAARAGKEVTAVIELRARFDEEANIQLATRLQDAGAYVAYGVVGHKTHAKMTLIVRRQGRRLKRFVHLGTGNYHAGTAKAYTDYGMLSDNSALGSDVHRLFLQLTGLGKSLNLKKMLSAPFTLHSTMVDHIRREAKNAKAGKKALVRAKMNSLIEPLIIEELYKASQAGVKIELIVRGVCSIRPGIQGVSENIHVRSVMGRFLEHTRVFYFYNNGEENLYCASADWMGRNFFKRVESCFPIEERALKRRIIKEVFTTYLRDNCQSWVLKANGSYKRLKPTRGAGRRNAHDILMEMMK